MFNDSFDTPSTRNTAIYDTSFSTLKHKNGMLVFLYLSTPSVPPDGIECALPKSAKDPEERVIDMSFGGGGSEMSNSLFVCYALGPGKGLSLPPFPYGFSSNSRSGDRTGYIIRFLRHGDGTDEVIFYRNDTGWVQKLKSVWLSSNPVTTLRRVQIRHRKNGEHIITAAFDTGMAFERTFTFEDNTYPPGSAQSRLQVICKAHASAPGAYLHLATDSWAVSDNYSIFPAKSGAPAGVGDAGTWGRGAADPDSRPEDADADALDILGLADIPAVRYSDAYRHLSRALDIRKKRLGPNHPKVVESLRHLATLYSNKNPEEAQRLYKEALKMQAVSIGPNHPDIVVTLKGIADLYLTVNNQADAETLYLLMIAIQEKSLGSNHPGLLPALSALARIYQNQ